MFQTFKLYGEKTECHETVVRRLTTRLTTGPEDDDDTESGQGYQNSIKKNTRMQTPHTVRSKRRRRSTVGG